MRGKNKINITVNTKNMHYEITNIQSFLQQNNLKIGDTLLSEVIFLRKKRLVLVEFKSRDFTKPSALAQTFVSFVYVVFRCVRVKCEE